MIATGELSAHSARAVPDHSDHGIVDDVGKDQEVFWVLDSAINELANGVVVNVTDVVIETDVDGIPLKILTGVVI